MLTGGGLGVFWVIDMFRVSHLVSQHNREQERRQAAGEPPVELEFMPSNAGDVLTQPPPWAAAWKDRGRPRVALRFAGDLLVLLLSASALGALVGESGGTEASVAVVALILVIMLGERASWLENIPGLRALVRWSHRLRLFYYFNRPGSPPALLLRGAVGAVLAPFRRKDRAEVRLYLELGAVFALSFLALDLVENVGGPLVRQGIAALSLERLAELWLEDAMMTFFITYVFAAPVGAVLTLYLLTRATHTLPRLLGSLALFFLALGAGVA